MNDLESAAHSYLSAGFAVIALTGKAPNTFFHKQGLNSALEGVPEDDDDNALIEKVFTHPTTSGIGVVIPAHRVVVDIDGNEGAVLFKKLAGDDVMDTPAALTGRGLHLWYASPHAHHSTRLGDKLDVKGLGGYVAAPPSKHPDGAIYKWLDSLVDEDSGQPAPVDWLPDGIEAELAKLAVVSASENDFHPGFGIKMIEPGVPKSRLDRLGAKRGQFQGMTVNGRAVRVYPFGFEPGKPNLSGLKQSIIDAPDGNQNNVISWAAMTARDEGVPLETAMEELLAAAIEGHHPRQRAINTIRSAYKRGRRD